VTNASRQWSEAKREARAVLVEIAQAGNIITYGDLANRIRTIELQADSRDLASLVGEISGDENSQRWPMLSAVVVNKQRGMPGKGFFALARELGRHVSDCDSFWVDEVRAVHEYWAQCRSSGTDGDDVDCVGVNSDSAQKVCLGLPADPPKGRKHLARLRVRPRSKKRSAQKLLGATTEWSRTRGTGESDSHLKLK
jgi:hypothetical protein